MMGTGSAYAKALYPVPSAPACSTGDTTEEAACVWDCRKAEAANAALPDMADRTLQDTHALFCRNASMALGLCPWGSYSHRLEGSQAADSPGLHHDACTESVTTTVGTPSPWPPTTAGLTAQVSPTFLHIPEFQGRVRLQHLLPSLTPVS